MISTGNRRRWKIDNRAAPRLAIRRYTAKVNATVRFLSRPLVTVPLEGKLLKITLKAVDLMLAQLGGALPRELTGRTRSRAWGIL